MTFGTRKELQMQAYSGKAFGGNKKEIPLTGKNSKNQDPTGFKNISARKTAKIIYFVKIFTAKFVIPTEEESPQVIPQSKSPIFVELLTEIPPPSE